MSQESNKGMLLLIGGGAAFAIVCTAVLVGLGSQMLATKSGGQPKLVVNGPPVLEVAGASHHRGSYKPSSAYIEKGADSNTTTFGFSGGEVTTSSGRSISESDITNVVYSHQRGLLECYMEGLEEDPDMAGRVKFHFRVAKDGHVAMAKVTASGLQDKETEDCLIDDARRWKFPATGKPGLLKFDTHFDFMTE